MIKDQHRLELICDGGPHPSTKDAHFVSWADTQEENYMKAAEAGWLIINGKAYCKEAWQDIFEKGGRKRLIRRSDKRHFLDEKGEETWEEVGEAQGQ